MPAGSCYGLDEDAGRVVVDAARPATVDAPRPSDVRPGYRLGWLFVGLEGWNAIQLGRNLPNGDPLLDVAVFGTLSSVILAVAAAWRSPPRGLASLPPSSPRRGPTA